MPNWLQLKKGSVESDVKLNSRFVIIKRDFTSTIQNAKGEAVLFL